MKNFTNIAERANLKKLIFSLLLLSVGFLSNLYSQAKDSRGTDFWLMFNSNYSSPTLTVFITSDVATTGMVTVPGLGFSVPFSVAANTVTPVVLPTGVAVHTSNVIDNKGIHVTALKEVTVYGLNYAPFTTDAYLGLPTDVLGTDYIVLSYQGNNLSELGIVATENNTIVTITPSATTSGRTVGVPFNITLNQGQTYELGNASDVTGTIITSTKPIGVMGANACANIPPGFAFCDHINEMLPPTTTWGKKFATVPLKSRASGDSWRFLAAENATVITINGVAQAPINRGQFIERVLTVQSVIESNKPILTAQYANGSTFSGNPGDPFMMIIPPLEQFLPKYTLSTVSGYVAHFINVIAPNAIVGTLTLDGVAVPASDFTPIGSTGFSGAQLTVLPGTHNLSGTLAFGVFQYGFNTDDSYGYPGGQSFSAIATISSLLLTPETGTATNGTSNCFKALVKDQFNNPVPGVRVDFEIIGFNPGSTGFAFTDANGIAQFCYAGANAGMDNIKASVGTFNDASTFNWIPVVVRNDYYSKPSGDLHNVLSWGVNLDGSGATPPDFGVGKTFHLVNRVPNYTQTANWTVGGRLDIPSGSQLRINGFTLSIADLIGMGSLSGTQTSSLVVTGAMGGDAGVLKFVSGGDWLNNFTLNRTGIGASVTISSALSIYGALTITNGALNTGNNITLKSTAGNTARVAPVTGTVSGNVTVERYIPARRAWRLMSAPVGGTQTISAAWQEGATTSSVNPNPKPGYGTHITEGSAANGFDRNPLVAMISIKKYLSTTDSWQTLSNTNATNVNSDAFLLFVRGHRATPLGYNTVAPTITTLRATGPLKTGNQTFMVSSTGYTAIPNPFASPINFATITKNNVQNNFYVWDPKLGGAAGVGGYVLLSFNGTTYDITPAPVSPESQYIQSGQGFLVRSTGVSGSIVIKESDKSATAAANVFRSSNSSTTTIGLRTTLQVAETIDNLKIMSTLDESFTSYGSSFSNKIDAMDPEKLANINENLGIERDGHTLMIERREPVSGNDTIRFKIWNTVPRDYVLQFSPVNLSSSSIISGLLEDSYLKTFTLINLDKVTTVGFNVNGDAGSFHPNRFRVILSVKKIALPEISSSRDKFKISPNPINGKAISLQLVDQPIGTYLIDMVNSSGQVIYRNQLKHPGGTATQTLQLNSAVISGGMYRLRITNKEANIKYALPLLSN